MTKVKALAIAALVTVTFLSAGLGISAHSSRSDAANTLSSVTQTAALSAPADQTQPQSIQAVLTAKHADHDEHDKDAVKTTRSATQQRGHGYEEEDD
jgi:hypothetical protein